MKKRVLSFLLCILMVLPLMLTSCGDAKDPSDTTEEEDTVYVKPASLNFYIVGTRVSEEAELLMEAAFNERAKKLFKTQVDFIFCTEKEYESIVLEKLEAADLAEQNGEKSAADKYKEVEIETTLDELNQIVEHYPSVYDNQVDIVLITSREMYDEFSPYLTDLTNLIQKDFRDIPQRINRNLIEAATLGNKMYAVPNNVLIGNYKYVLVNKEMAYLLNYTKNQDDFYTTLNESSTKKFLSYSQLTTLARQIQDCRNAMSGTEDYTIAEKIKENLGVTNFYPLNVTFDYPTVSYMPMDGENTIFGVVYDYNSTYTNLVELVNVFDHKIYREHFEFMLAAKAEELYPDATLTADADDVAYGIMYLEGSYTDRFAYEEDYFVFEVDQPRLEDNGAFDAMFAVPKFSADPYRAMEIISALVAEDEDTELRNILQYGKEGDHYTVDEKSGMVTRKVEGRTSYMMNVNYTGNVITAYPCLEDGRDVNYASYFKQQNDAAIRNPLYKLDSADLWDDAKTNFESIILVERMIEELKKEIDELPKDGKIINNNEAHRQEIKNAIPADPTVANLREFWEIIRAEYDPTKTYEDEAYEELQNKIREISRQLTNDLVALQDQVKEEADDYLTLAASVGEDFMEQALACKTAEELKAVCDVIKSRDTKVNPNAMYLYADRSTAWGVSGYIGMLIRQDDCPMSLASALFAWWQGTLSKK